MWNLSLLLLYPNCQVTHLDTLRQWLLGHVRRLILRGLRGYLKSSYGFELGDHSLQPVGLQQVGLQQVGLQGVVERCIEIETDPRSISWY
jgi:hypothetical protein